MSDRPPPLRLPKLLLFHATAAVLALVVGVAMAEAAYRLYVRSRPVETKKFRKALDYGDTWRTGGLGPGGLLLEGFDAQVFDGNGGTVRWTNNSQGFRSDREFGLRPASGVLRVLSMGDSFTAGYRVAQGATYSDWIDGWLSEEHAPAEVLISCVESPSRGLDYLKTYGGQWQPDVVLLGVTLGNDIAQDYVALHPEPIGFHHGLEAYDLPESSRVPVSQSEGDGLPSFLRRHSWIYADLFPPVAPITPSYGEDGRNKMFDPSHGLGFFLREPPPIVEEAYRRHLSVLSALDRYCKSEGIAFAVMVLPQRFQVQPADWEATVRGYGLNEEAFDLGLPNRLLREHCAENGIALIDPTSYMQEVHEASGIDLYLPRGDMHWNPDGHRVAFEGARPGLERLIRSSIAESNRPALQASSD